MNDVFYFTEGDGLTNYADDTTPYAVEHDTYTLVSNLQNQSIALQQWFNNNFFKLNVDICKVIIANCENDEFYSTSNGQKAISYVGPKLWDDMPNYLKQIKSIASFKHDF